MDRGWRHPQLTADGSDTQPLPSERPHFRRTILERAWPAQPYAPRFCCRQTRLYTVPNQVSLKFTHRLQDIELELPARVAASRINSLTGTNQRDLEPGQFVHEEAKVGNAPSESVEMTGHKK